MTFATLLDLAFKVPWKRIFRRKKRCLLIVEDAPEDGEFLKALIEVMGYEGIIVDTAEAGLALITEKPEKFPIVFIDLKLRLMNGLTLIQKVTAVAPQAHCVVVTGAAERLEDLLPGLYIGVVQKPVSSAVIKAVINKTRL